MYQGILAEASSWLSPDLKGSPESTARGQVLPAKHLTAYSITDCIVPYSMHPDLVDWTNDSVYILVEIQFCMALSLE